MRGAGKLGHTVKVIGPADFPRTMPMPGYPEIRLAIMPYGRLKRMIEEYKPDYIHIPAEGPLGWAARRYCLKHGKSFSTSYHTHFPDYVAKRVAKHMPFLYKPAKAIGKMVVRTFHGPSRVMMVATQSLEDELKSWNFKTPMRRMIRGARLDMYYPGENTVYKDLPHPIAVYVGRVSIEKSIEDFLKMPWEGSKVVVGDGPSLKELSRKYPDAVFVGKKTGADLAAHYRSADIFAFPSRTDTFGIVLIEALASGLPIAAYNVTGPKDIITQDFLGALEETDLAKAARRALSSGTKEQRADHVKALYTWEHAAQQFMRALDGAPPPEDGG
ncbi:MAG: glycosyltransferase [Alphaproteobacteria bacterium]|nr:glycosyltransferase [Alphaproteobacteria bacterium]